MSAGETTFDTEKRAERAIITNPAKLRALIDRGYDRFVAEAVGKDDMSTIYEWVKEGSMPETAGEKVGLLFDAMAAINLAFDDKETAIAFMRGDNPYLGQSPLETIRDTEDIEQSRLGLGTAITVLIE